MMNFGEDREKLGLPDVVGIERKRKAKYGKRKEELGFPKLLGSAPWS